MKTRAHYVPRFYLRNFSEAARDPRQPERLWVRWKSTGKVQALTVNNLAVAKGLYDGPAGFKSGMQLESHLSQIESDAAAALAAFVVRTAGSRGAVPPALTRFIAWQAARSLSMEALYERWVNESPPLESIKYAEPPPEGFDRIVGGHREHEMEAPDGTRVRVRTLAEVESHRAEGWRLRLSREDFRELLHLQAWYFQVRFFPRLAWMILDAPPGSSFITSDRAVAWGFAAESPPPPHALRLPGAQVVAPLTATVALVGTNGTIDPGAGITPHEINLAVASMAQLWTAGPDRESVLRAAV